MLLSCHEHFLKFPLKSPNFLGSIYQICLVILHGAHCFLQTSSVMMSLVRQTESAAHANMFLNLLIYNPSALFSCEVLCVVHGCP